MKRVKIFGAGSIGNHLANASRRKGWSVDICDTDPAALERTRELIYPSRYGKWDSSIGMYTNDKAPVGDYDLIVIGTPPDSHMQLARQAVKEKPKAILVEKPVCTPDLAGAQALYEEAAANVKLFVGYDHAVSKSAMLMSRLLSEQAVGPLDTLDVEFREFWAESSLRTPGSTVLPTPISVSGNAEVAPAANIRMRSTFGKISRSPLARVASQKCPPSCNMSTTAKSTTTSCVWSNYAPKTVCWVAWYKTW